jgi:hypothetical protein
VVDRDESSSRKEGRNVMKTHNDRSEAACVTRRDLGRLGIGLAVAVGSGLGARRAWAQEEGMVTEFAENAALVQALSYIAVSNVEGAKCANCALYLGADAPKGKCGLFQKGLVSAEGHCASWSKRNP